MHPSQPSDNSRSGIAVVRDLTRRVFGYAMFFSFICVLLNLTATVNMYAMYGLVIPSQNAHNAPVITGGALVLLALFAVVMDLRSRLLIRFGMAVDQLLSGQVILGMLQDAAQQGRRGFSEAMADLTRIRTFLSTPAAFAYFESLLAPVQLLIIYLLSPLLALVAFIGLLLLILLTWRLQKQTHLPMRYANVLAAGNRNFLQECLRNSEAVKGMGMTGALSRRWQDTHDKVLAVQFEASEKAGILTALSKALMMVMSVALLGIGAYQAITTATIDPGVVIMASIIGGQMLGPLHRAISNWGNMQEAVQSYERLKELFAELDQEPDRMGLPAPEGRLSAEQVSYGVPQQIILQGVSLDLAAGEFLGIIGPMAAGKTTLARILTGVTPPIGGKVRLDGADIHIWDQTDLGRYLGYLPQEVELFPGTIGENISRMGTADPEKMAVALRRSGLGPIIEELSDGLDTVIEERGGSLPGGLRQRIGLARALYGDPRLVVMDEPDANLDENGRRDLLGALSELRRMKTTVVMVTHRISLLKQADKILVLRDGRSMLYGPAAEVWAQLSAPAQATPALNRA